MSVENFGRWEVYTLPSDHPKKELETEHGIIFRRSVDDPSMDWYDFRDLAPANRTWLLVQEETGRVLSAENAIDRISPMDCLVVSIPRRPDDQLDELRFKQWLVDWDTGTLISADRVSDVTAAQAKVALLDYGIVYDKDVSGDPIPGTGKLVLGATPDLLTRTEEIVEAFKNRRVSLWFREARIWERQNPYVLSIGLELDLTEEQVDDLFIYAGTLSQ
jgi:hypothetical protein